ncbi:MAG: alpha/beta hydrolase [Polaromonas sp.]|nr:alpha/beta hydrolase [Polaromonas sp.]
MKNIYAVPLGLISMVLANSLAFAQLAAAPVAVTVPVGEIKGSAVQHTAASAEGVVQRASVVLPASVTGAAVYVGTFANAPKDIKARVPVVVFLHGSSGLGLKAIGEWQLWLASLGVASMAPDSFALPDRLTYTSPVSKDVYEKIHALRASEIPLTLQALRSVAWADTSRMVLAGASEGGPAVARYTGNEFAGRILYSWSCENNYFVQDHRSAQLAQPVLNVMSSTDVFFSPSNSWLGNAVAKGYCGDALKEHKQASIVLIPGAPHTLLNLPAARIATAGFVRDVLKP